MCVTTPQADSLLILRSEDLFAATASTMARVQSFLALDSSFPPSALLRARNRNTLDSRSRPSAELVRMLDGFFAPYNEQLYAWMHAQGKAFRRWDNGSSHELALAPRPG